ncbi:MAG TPA: histidine-type phosphatase [Bryobacteraceae bacterium]|nr:histidine-type phosphatase [Bryobacteraceae bacterium]
MKTPALRHVTLALLCGPFLAALPARAQSAPGQSNPSQSSDDTQLKQVIIFGRHGVRTPILPDTYLDGFSAMLFPTFTDSSGAPLGVGVLTPNGATDETILGSYFRLWLTQEGLLTGHDQADANFVYFRANNTPLITGTATAFWTGMLPTATPHIQVVAQGSDPLFDPVDAGVAQLDYPTAVAAVNGRLGSNPQALATAYAPELALTRSILFDYPVSTTPAPLTPTGKTDVTALPITLGAGDTSLPVTIGGLTQVIEAIDPFVMEYTDGLPDAQVGWGQLTTGSINQTFRLYDLLLDLEFRTPYLASVQSSNLASHIVRSMMQASSGSGIWGALANPSTKVIALIASNTNIVGLAGLFHLDWLLPGYEADVSAPSGALVFELRQSQSSGAYIVRTVYIAQTMDQLRNQTAFTLAAPPPSAPVFIPGCSVDNATFDCPLTTFIGIANQVIDPHSADLVH